MLVLILGILVAVAGVVLISRATIGLAEINANHRLPLTWGRFAVKPSGRNSAERVAGQGLAAIGAFLVVAGVWGHSPKLSIVAGAATLVIAIAVPIVVITLRHNRSVASGNGR